MKSVIITVTIPISLTEQGKKDLDEMAKRDGITPKEKLTQLMSFALYTYLRNYVHPCYN